MYLSRYFIYRKSPRRRFLYVVSLAKLAISFVAINKFNDNIQKSDGEHVQLFLKLGISTSFGTIIMAVYVFFILLTLTLRHNAYVAQKKKKKILIDK